VKLVTFRQGGEHRVGAIEGDGAVVDLNRAYAASLRDADGTSGRTSAALADASVPTDMVAFIEGGEPTLDAARRALAHGQAMDAGAAARDLLRVRDAELVCPIPNPPKIVCVARNYAEHAKEAGLEISPIPILFARFATTLVPPGGDVVLPTVSDQLDWEGELALVIGRRGRHVSEDDDMSYIAGYTIFNDVTVRDYQFRVTQYTEGKNFHATGPLGPYIATADEVPDPHDLEIVTTVSGVEKQRASTADMIYSIPRLVSHISDFIELQPGDVIPTGTPAGVGFKRTPPEFLAAGDVVSVSVTGLGVLENPVVSEAAA
jgi:2-keto-4-pentenoate hydratase/2-oxohepta-3-ene-1,7-dioic acid hydratase in catechol pathway